MVQGLATALKVLIDQERGGDGAWGMRRGGWGVVGERGQFRETTKK